MPRITNTLTASQEVPKDQAHLLAELPRGSYVQEWDGFYNWVLEPNGFILLTSQPFTGTPRKAEDLEFPVIVHFIPQHNIPQNTD